MNEVAISAIDKIAPALAKAQGELTNPPKTKTAQVRRSAEKGGGHSHSYKYADLAEIIDHVRPVLTKHGLTVIHMIESGERNKLVTRLIHESGQYFESVYPLPLAAAAQEMGSAITYARRYSLCAILGIAAEEDDDGQKAMNAPTEDDTARNDLVERMGNASLGNGRVMEYCKANGLGDGKTVEDLPIASVQHLLSGWDSIVAAIKAPKATAEKPVDKAPETPAATDEGEIDPYAGIDAELVTLLKADGITPDKLHAYYSTPTGSPPIAMLPATVTPDKLPPSFLKAMKLPANWKKVVGKIKGTK